MLEPVCCKKRQKKFQPKTGLGNMGPLIALNYTKLILNDKRGHSCSFITNVVSFRTFRWSLFPKLVSWLGLFFAVSYSKPALEVGENLSKLLESNKIKTKTKLRQRNEKREKNFHLMATHTMRCNLF